MTSGRILVVDDLAVNRRVMAAQLTAEYFDVHLAQDGFSALALCETEPFDLVLLDVMMPGIDGFEVCRRLKARPQTQHVPVILLTALDQPEHRIAGLEAGADDFLTKPATNAALLSRLRALLRVKLTADEVRNRLDIVSEATVRRQLQADLAHPGTGGRIVLCAANPSRAQRLRGQLARDHHIEFAEPGSIAARCSRGDVDVAIVDLTETRSDPLRICAQLKADPSSRRTAVLLLAEASDEARVERAMTMGAADFVTLPVDPSELAVRVRTQVKRGRYAETLRFGVRQSAELAVRDSLTALYNRRFLNSALEEAILKASESRRSLSILIADLDHFKQVNDRYGHDVGDAVLRTTADRLRETIRASDFACRIGGEEFVVLMPDADGDEAQRIGERLRAALEERAIETAVAALRQTVSIGVATLSGTENGDALLKRADRGLYEAKSGGRNRVVLGRSA